MLLTSKDVRRIERDLGNYIIGKAKEFCRERGGLPESLETNQLRDCIFHQNCLKQMNDAHQYLQTAFMPNYEQNLYDFYRQQQYLILLTFLSYPFRYPGSLISQIKPYILANARLRNMRILDYGAGLPFGLIHLLRTYSRNVKSITIVDLDLVHTELVEFILNDLCSDSSIDYIRVKNPASIPDFGDRTFNFIYGKDIFEHLHNPEKHLSAMLAKADNSCICYFDFSNHGAKYLQHVHPHLSHLSEYLSEKSFTLNGEVGKMDEFFRNV